MRCALVLSVLLAGASLGLPTGAAQETSLLTEIQPGDPFLDRNVRTVLARVVFADLDGDNTLDITDPDETYYFDLDGSGSVTYKDMRLSPAGRYVPGSLVNSTNWDLGRETRQISGWFARGQGGLWYLDADNNRRVSIGDVELAGARVGVKIPAGDGAIGQVLEPIQQAVVESDRVGWVDMDNDGTRDRGEPVVLDADRNLRVSFGDVRIHPGLLPDDLSRPAPPAPAEDPDESDGDGEPGPTAQDVELMEDRLQSVENQMQNQQRTLERLEERIAAMEANGSPGPGAVLALLALAGVALVLRRRPG